MKEAFEIINTIAAVIGYFVVILGVAFWISVLWARYEGMKEGKKWLDEIGGDK